MSKRPDAPRLDLHIEEVVLEGFAPGDRYRIGEAIQLELGRLFAEAVPAWLGESGHVNRLDAMFDLAPGSRAKAVGVEVAGAVYRGLQR